MVVMWVTLAKLNESSIVEYGRTGLSLVAKGARSEFVDGGKEKRVIYMHRVTLTGLSPGEKYSKLIRL